MNEETRKKDPFAKFRDVDWSAQSDSEFAVKKNALFRTAKAVRQREEVEREARAILDAEAVADDDTE